MSVSDELQTGEDVLALSFADVTVLPPELHGVLAPGVGVGTYQNSRLFSFAIGFSSS